MTILNKGGNSLIAINSSRILWAGDLCARLGHQVCAFTLPLIVVIALHGSGTQVGLVSAFQFFPVLVLSLFVGAWTQWLPLHKVLIFSNLGRAIAFLCLGIVYATAHLELWLVLIIAIVIGSTAVFYDIVLQVFTPRLFSGSKLVSLNGLLQATASMTQMGGPALAGFLVQTAGITITTLFISGLLCISTSIFSLLESDSDKQDSDNVKIGSNVKMGLHFMAQCRPIRDLCIQSALFNLHEQAFLTIFLIFGVRTLGLSSGLVGTLIGFGSIGAIVSSIVASKVAAKAHLGQALVFSIFIASVGLMLVSLFATMNYSIIWLGIGFIINGGAMAFYNILAVTLRQDIPSANLLGTVTASYRLVAFGTMPLGAMFGGVLVDILGANSALIIVASLLVLSSLFIFTSPLREAPDLGKAREISGI